MGPDRAVVIRERVVAGVARGHGAHAPTGPELVSHQLVDDRVDAFRRDDAAPEQMADVRAERVDLPLVAVERQRVVAAALLDPEGLVEAVTQLGCLALEAIGELAVTPYVTRDIDEPSFRVVHVTLHLAWSDRRLCQRAVVKALRIPRVLPGLVVEPTLGPALVLDEPVAVAVSVLVDPFEREQRRLFQVTDKGSVVGPAPHLGEQDQVERGRVDGPVVALEPDAGSLAVPDLVHDLAWLGVDGRVFLFRLQLGQHLEGRACQLGAEHKRLQARDDRVAPENGHEPRHPCAGEPADARMVRLHPQGREVGDRLAERVRQGVPRRSELRYPQLPGGERVADATDLLTEAAVGEPWRDELAVRKRDDLDVEAPALARLQREMELHRGAVNLAALGEDHLRLQREIAVVGDQELVALLVVVVRPGLRERLRAKRITEREVVVLHGEDVREVRRDLELEVELDGLHPLVLHGERVLHPVADEALTPDRQHVLLQAAREWVAHEERGREVLDLVRGEQERTQAVDREPEARQETGVLGEETFALVVEVADLVTDTEGRAFEDSQLSGHQLSLRSIRPPEDCASALTTSSSTLTCAGRVTAKRTQSAMSSGCMASTPWYTLVAVSSSPRKRTREKSVSTSPGSTVVMWIGRPSRSSRSAYVKPRTANFEVT